MFAREMPMGEANHWAEPDEYERRAALSEPLLGCGCASCAGVADQMRAASSAPVVRDHRALLNESFYGFERWNADGFTTDAAVGVTFVTYSFREEGDLPPADRLSRGATDAVSFTDEQRGWARDALAQWDRASGLVFIEVEDGGMIDLFGVTGSTVGGYSYGANRDRGGFGETVVDVGKYQDLGRQDWLHVLLHEVGHRIGLAHPHEGSYILADDLDHQRQTVMSYNRDPLPSGGLLRPLDLDAARFLYGADADPDELGLSYGFDPVTGIFSVGGTDGDDAFNGVNARNLLHGGPGNDHLLGALYDDEIVGGPGSDTLAGSGGADLLEGGEGDDVLRVGGHESTLRGGAGDDVFEIGAMQPVIDGGVGYDIIRIGTLWGGYLSLRDAGTFVGIEALEGGEGGDFVVGHDTIGLPMALGGGDDTYVPMGAADLVDLGDGFDTIYFADLLDGPLTLDLATGQYTNASGFDLTFRVVGAEALVGSTFADEMRGTSTDDRLEGEGGDDVVFGLSGADTLSGGVGSDMIDGGAGADMIYGDDAIVIFG